MRLSQRIVGHVFLFAVVYCILLAFTLSTLVRPRFRALEEERAAADVARVRAVMEHELSALDASLMNNAYWDDTVRYVLAPDPTFIELNLSQPWLESLAADLICIADASGRILHEAAFEPETGTAMNITGLFAPGGAGERLITADAAETRGFVRQGDALIALASREIRSSDGAGPARGRMVFGHIYGASDARRLSKLLGVQAAFTPPATPEAGETRIEDRGKELLARISLSGLDGAAAGTIELIHRKNIVPQGERLIRYVILATALLGVLLLAAIYALVNRSVIRPLEGMAARAAELEHSRAFGERLEGCCSDEITALAASFNRLLDALAGVNEGLESAVAARTRELKAANEKLELMGEVFAHSLEGIIVTDAEARILAVNPAFERITGLNAASCIGQNPRIMGSGRHSPEFFAAMWKALTTEGSWAGELWNRRPDGSPYPIWISISSLRDGQGPRRYVGVFRDVSDAKRQEGIIRYQAFHDALTGLPNRLLLSDRIASAIERARRRGSAAALVFLDLDRFKIINDSLGHAEGDRLLQEVARRLKAVARGEDVVARLGGDEFVILLEDVNDSRVPADVALRIIKAIGRAFELGETSVRIGASVGIALFPGDGDDAETLLRNADTAMYRAKEEGRNTFRLFTPELNAKVARRLSLESELRHDVEARSLSVRYQPQVSLASGLTYGFEALVRWKNRAGAIICPDEFIPLAEETGIVVEIDRTVMNLALGETATILNSSATRLALNCSARGLLHKDLPDCVRRFLADSGVGPEHLEIEVTESALMHDVEAGVAVLGKLADMGISIALDDFGTGYSSLSQLKRLPLDTIKIDRSFITHFLEDEQDRGIVDTILSIAKRLGLGVIAEGVETEAQAAYLREAGCETAQGYLYARPLERSELEGFLARIPPEPLCALSQSVFAPGTASA